MPHPSQRRHAGIAILGLSLALLAAYSNSFQGELIFDDLPSIRDNASLRRLWPLTTVLWPPDQTGKTVDGRPLVNLSLAINYAISGLDVWSYHVFNLAIHLAATLTLFGLVRQTLRLPRVPQRSAEHATGLAFVIALIWGLHPLQTESVTYVVQRAESIVGLFYLLTLYCVAGGETAARPTPWHTAAWLACLAGMATKEVMVTAPVVVFLYLWVFVFGTPRETLRQRGRLLMALAATWLLLAVLVISSKGRGGTVGSEAEVSVLGYAMTQFMAIVHYLKLVVCPRPLVLDYGIELARDRTQIILCGLLVAMLCGASLWAMRARPWIGFLGCAFFLILAPSSSVVPIATQTMAEHRMYLPLAAVVSLVVLLCGHASGRPAIGRLTTLLLALLVLSLGLQTWLRNLDYRTGLSIWRDTVEKWPHNPRAHAQLTEQLLLAGNADAALNQAERGVLLVPDSPWSYYNRGTLLLQLGQFERAVSDFDRAVQMRPDFADAYQNRGVAQRRLGNLEPAVADFTQALNLNPRLKIAYRNRALTLAALGRIEEARADAQTYLAHTGRTDKELQEVLDRK